MTPTTTVARLPRGVALVLLLAIAAFSWAVSRGWSYPLTDSHGSRQAQTAITAEMLHRDGWSPLTPFNGLGPPWNVPMEFPTYQLLASATTPLWAGNVISAARLISVLAGLAILPALWLLLARLQLPPPQRLFALVGLLVCPLWIHYSRAVLIESLATTLSVWLFVAWLGVMEGQKTNRRWLGAAVILAVFAGLTKVTSFAVILPAAFAITILDSRRLGLAAWWRSGLATGPGVIAAVIWTRWSDAVKMAHPYADFLTSSALTDWNWGTLAQRLDPAWWLRWWHYINEMVPPWSLLLVVIGFTIGSARLRGAIGLCLLVVVTGPLTFANLYYVHDYYHMATVPALVLAVALGLVAVRQKWPTARASAAVAGLVAVGWWASATYAYYDGLGQSQVRNNPVPAFADLLRELTTPDDVVLIYGREWDPLITFYADRRMTTIRETHETDETAWQASVAALAPKRYTVLIAFYSVAGDTAFVQHRVLELGLSSTPVASTENADIYVTEARAAELAPRIASLQASGRLLPSRPERMEPGESRIEFIVGQWNPVPLDAMTTMYRETAPVPDAVFAKHNPAQMEVDGTPVLHIHPPGGLRYTSLSRDRVAHLDYGIMPEIWEKERDSDGVRFRIYFRGPDGRDRLGWEDFVQPRKFTSDQAVQHATIPVPAGHEMELRIDAGPDHNPGYDWSYVQSLRLEVVR